MYSTQSKPFTSCCIFGSKGAGKSTLFARFLYEIGGITERDIHKLKRESKDLHGDESHAYSFYSDRTKIERLTLQTVYNLTRVFYTNKHHIALTDTPGNIKYKNQKIRGISVSDFGILVLSAATEKTKDSEEITTSDALKTIYRSVSSYWIRKNKLSSFPNELYSIITSYALSNQFDDVFFQNILIAHTFFIKQLIICINKMDLIDYNQNEYEYIKNSTEIAVQQYCDYHNISMDINILPICAIKGINIKDNEKMKWYKGNTFLDAIEAIKISPENCNVDDCRPTRMMINECYRIRGVGDVFCGKLIQGKLMPGQQIKILPDDMKLNRNGKLFSIERFWRNEQDLKTAEFGGLNIKHYMRDSYKYDGADYVHVKVLPSQGDVLVIDNEENQKIKKCETFMGMIKIINVIGTNKKKDHCIKIGYNVNIYIHLAKVPCDIQRIVWKKPNKNNVSKLSMNDEAEVVFKPLKPVYIERFDDCKELGVFIGMNSNILIMTGRVKSVNFK